MRKFCDYGELMECCTYTIDAGMEVDMAQFKRNSSSDLGADFPNRFMSLYMLWDSEEVNRSPVLLFIYLDDFYNCIFVQML